MNNTDYEIHDAAMIAMVEMLKEILATLDAYLENEQDEREAIHNLICICANDRMDFIVTLVANAAKRGIMQDVFARLAAEPNKQPQKP